MTPQEKQKYNFENEHNYFYAPFSRKRLELRLIWLGNDIKTGWQEFLYDAEMLKKALIESDFENKSNSSVLKELFQSFNKKYLNDILSQQSEEKQPTAFDIVHNPDFEKTITEVKYNFSKN